MRGRGNGGESMNMRQPKTQTIIPPRGGWKEHTWYLVDVSYSKNNPIHRDLLYTGFLGQQGQPQGYHALYAQGDCNGIQEVSYLKALKVVCCAKDYEGPRTVRMQSDLKPRAGGK